MTAQRANSLTGAEWLKHSFSIWRGIGRDKDAKCHPAPFPVALVSRIIDCYVADRAGVLLDPFAGSGSSLLAAMEAGMSAVGCDINPSYRAMFQQRISLFEASGAQCTYEIADARSCAALLAPASVEICVTSPPYWDILNRKRTADGKSATPYSVSGEDLGNMDSYDGFLEALALVAAQVGQALRPKGYFVLNVMDIRKGASFYPLHQDASRAVVDTGAFALEDIVIWDRQAEYNSMRPLGYPYKFIVNKVHEYLLVFRKGGNRNG